MDKDIYILNNFNSLKAETQLCLVQFAYYTENESVIFDEFKLDLTKLDRSTKDAMYNRIVYEKKKYSNMIKHGKY